MTNIGTLDINSLWYNDLQFIKQIVTTGVILPEYKYFCASRWNGF